MVFFKKNINGFIAVGLSFWGLYLRGITLNNRAFDGDDLYQFVCMQGPFKPFWLPQKYGDFSSFPGDYLLNFFVVQWFGLSKWGLAIPHILVTILGFWLLYKLGRYYFKSWVGYAVAFTIVAFNRELVFHAFEFRPYAVLPVLALGTLYLAHQYFERFEHWTKARAWGAGLLIVGILNYHMYGPAILLLPGAFAGTVFALRGSGQGTAKGTIKTMLPTAIPLFIALLAGLGIWVYYAFLNYSWVPKSVYKDFYTFQYIANPVEKPLVFLKAVLGNLIGFKWGYVFLLSLGLAWFVPAGRKIEQFIFLSLLVLLPILLILAADLKGSYWFLQRQFVWVMPFFAIFLGWQWDALYGALKARSFFRGKFLTEYFQAL